MDRKVVISRYNEPLDWISGIECDYIIYNKGEEIENPDIPKEKILNVPNEGREAETFLRYIVSNYNNLPEFLAYQHQNTFYIPVHQFLFDNFDFSAIQKFLSYS